MGIAYIVMSTTRFRPRQVASALALRPWRSFLFDNIFDRCDSAYVIPSRRAAELFLVRRAAGMKSSIRRPRVMHSLHMTIQLRIMGARVDNLFVLSEDLCCQYRRSRTVRVDGQLHGPLLPHSLTYIRQTMYICRSLSPSTRMPFWLTPPWHIRAAPVACGPLLTSVCLHFGLASMLYIL